MAGKPDLKLGLIGDNIAESRAPLLHRLAGAQSGLDVQYNRLIPKEIGVGFDELFERCTDGGYRGVNVTYPYKERVAEKVTIADPLVRAIGAINTVLFDANRPTGYNTDYSGFIAAYKVARGDAEPGVACIIGTGGVGRALAFGLIALGAKEIRLCDNDETKAQQLAKDLCGVTSSSKITVYADSVAAAQSATGLLNGTPVGMVGYGGTPLLAKAMSNQEWAFDAVYTPVNTQFLQDAKSASLSIISGYELFFFQGVHAWGYFSGAPLDEARLRSNLADTK